MTRKQRRGVLIATGVGILSVAVFLVLFALRDTIVFFHTPKEVVERQVPAGKRIRLGGLVAEASVKRGLGETIDFAITDTVLAKHDETYMPPEVAKALKEQGLWQHGEKAKQGARK
jgi:cytochrome c-type biogenesis protein CcmE